MRKRFLVCSAQGFGEPVWQPLADIYRVTKGWLIKVDLAGIRLQDIEVRTHGNCLTIEGIRKDFSHEESLNYYTMEIAYNRFRKSIELPVQLDQAHIGLEYRDGMLLIRIEREDTQNA